MADDRSHLWQESDDWMGVPCGITYAESQLSGTPHMLVTFDIDGHKKQIKLWLTERAEARTMELLGQLGFNGDFVNPSLSRTEPCKLSCKHDVYEGKWKENWTFWGDQKTFDLDRGKAAQLAARFKATASAGPKPPGKPTPPPTAGSKPAATAPPANTASKPAPPKPHASAPPAKVATNSDEAWAYWLKQTSNMNDDTRNEHWREAVDQFGKAEDQITPEEWNKVALAADIPF